MFFYEHRVRKSFVTLRRKTEKPLKQNAMPNTKNAMLRYQILDRLLSDRRHNYSLDDLTEVVSDEICELNPQSDGVVRRTIEKDIAFLEFDNTPPAVIERYTVDSYSRERQREVKKHCLRYEDPSFTIFNKAMSDDERELLGEAMSLIGHFEGLPGFEQLEALRQKAKVKRRRHHAISLPKSPAASTNVFGQLFKAIVSKQVVDISYHRFKHPESDQYMVYPYLLKEYNRRWYLICEDVKDGSIRNLSVDRFERVTPVPSVSYKKFDGDILKRYDEVIGVTFYPDKEVQHIEFWVSDASNDFVATKPMHHSQHAVSIAREKELRDAYPKLNGGTFFSIDCRENYELIRELTSFGKELLVISPVELRNTVCNRIVEMTAAYADLYF